jgi:hypothetical protein
VVPFVRVTRDKRGYEHIALMHASSRRGKPGKPRTIYVFRTPPGVKLGREPFDETVRRLIEEQNPGLHFDWKKLSHIAPPAPDVEFWREKRRLEKAARQARREQELEDSPREQRPTGAAAAPLDAKAETLAEAQDESIEDEGVVAEEIEPQPLLANGGAQTAPGPPGLPGGQRRRRRRRGGRGRRRHPQAATVAAAPGPAEPPKVADDPSKER